MLQEETERHSDDRLQSWKEIAAYLRFGVRTVQRWAEAEGLPVYRRTQDRRSTVFAYKRELDTWYESRKNTLTESNPETNATSGPVTDSGLPFPVSGEVDWPGAAPEKRPL